MKSSVTNVVIPLATVAMAALGGAAAVYSEFDDAPGGVLIGYLLILGAAVLAVRTAQRRK